MEIDRAAARGVELPARIEVGAMVEVPSLYWQMNALLQRVEFLSIGSNDLFQFLFACDRGNPALVDRYDVLSPAALSFLHDMVERCRAAGVRLAVCGEMASRPLEAMALIGLGMHHLSLTPSEVGPVKAMLRSIDAGAARRSTCAACSICPITACAAGCSPMPRTTAWCCRRASISRINALNRRAQARICVWCRSPDLV